ncbi:hypothetical protein GDO78_018661 [Eleutherodactylus coqui]|uniref:Secreted protein n=1 Tax=Eleutherodactylus coqui TaxID=57060 RepID=A0A8J6EAX9_ELECQ|nr:hypothetical protein GDO78_018661 [Eleutherodactylus coqui]
MSISYFFPFFFFVEVGHCQAREGVTRGAASQTQTQNTTWKPKRKRGNSYIAQKAAPPPPTIICQDGADTAVLPLAQCSGVHRLRYTVTHTMKLRFVF